MDTQNARLVLARIMTQISEERWAAGWLTDLEHILWTEVLGRASPDALALADLARDAGGWFIYPSGAIRPEFMPMEDWIARYQQHTSTAAPP